MYMCIFVFMRLAQAELAGTPATHAENVGARAIEEGRLHWGLIDPLAED